MALPAMVSGVTLPFLDSDLGSAQTVEDLAGRESIANPKLKAYATPILSVTGLDECRLWSKSRNADTNFLLLDFAPLSHLKTLGGALQD